MTSDTKGSGKECLKAHYSHFRLGPASQCLSQPHAAIGQSPRKLAVSNFLLSQCPLLSRQTACVTNAVHAGSREQHAFLSSRSSGTYFQKHASNFALVGTKFESLHTNMLGLHCQSLGIKSSLIVDSRINSRHHKVSHDTNSVHGQVYSLVLCK